MAGTNERSSKKVGQTQGKFLKERMATKKMEGKMPKKFRK